MTGAAPGAPYFFCGFYSRRNSASSSVRHRVSPRSDIMSHLSVTCQGVFLLLPLFYAQGDLGNCDGKREKLWFANYRTARLAPDLCTTMPSGGRRVGTNSVHAGSCLNPDDRAMQSMITSVWRRMGRHDRRCGNGTRWPTYEDLNTLWPNRFP
jgi:hypothetical protein